MSSTKCLDLMIKVATHLESVNKSSDTRQPQFIGLKIYTVFHYMVYTFFWQATSFPILDKFSLCSTATWSSFSFQNFSASSRSSRSCLSICNNFKFSFSADSTACLRCWQHVPSRTRELCEPRDGGVELLK